MKRALLPWLFPVAVLLGLLIAATNSSIVYGATLIVAAWGVLPFALSRARRSGSWPRSLGGGSDGNRRRFPGFR
ncbi:MAG TPA: hypothetical protein VG365_10740 [Solirubrobacteraceae bacterium]|nr:hypothetical protein [Solirubrobacteraceae bacterium]